MAQIFISYGITKSASTFAWQLIKRVAIAGGLPVATLTAKSKGANSPEDYIDPISDERLALIRADIGDRPVVIKTHGRVTPAVARLVSAGAAQAFVSYRDLRDVALSLLDHAARSRALQISDFADLHTLTDTIPMLQEQVRRFEAWVTLCKPLLIPYDEICFDTKSTIHRVADRLGVSLNVDVIAEEFHNNKHLIGQFNKGKGRRFEDELEAETSLTFLKTFANYYKSYLPEEMTRTPVVAAESESSTGSQPASKLTKDDVVWCYRSLLGREPESADVVERQAALPLDFRSLVLRFISSAEFQKKRVANTRNNAVADLQYRCPTDLTVTPTQLRRVIIVGGCLMTNWSGALKDMQPACKSDYFLFNNVQRLPENPPAKIDEYDFQVVSVPLRSVLPDRSYFRLSYADHED